MDVAGRDLHHLFDVPATFPNHMRVLCIGHIHLQSHLVYLNGKNSGVIFFNLTLDYRTKLNLSYRKLFIVYGRSRL